MELQDVVEDDLVDRDLGQLPRPQDPRVRRREDGEPLELPLGPQLLEHPDGGVGDEHGAEEGVLGWPDDRDDHEKAPEDGVEPGEQVGPQDLAEGPSVLGGRRVDEARGDPRFDLLGFEPSGGVRLDRPRGGRASGGRAGV